MRDIILDVGCRLDAGSSKKLQAVLDRNVTKLALDFGSCGVGSAELSAIGTALPQGLEHLALDFLGCGTAITDEGIESLLAKIPCNLERLNIDLSYCNALSDRGLVALGSALNAMPRLISLHIAIQRCAVGDEGVEALSACLPQGLRELSLKCGNCKVGDRGAQALATHLPLGLSHLVLDFCNCNVGVEGAKALGAALPSSVEELQLNFEACPVQNVGAVAIAAGVPTGVVVLELAFPFCDLSEMGASSFSHAIADASQLHRLSIDLRHNIAIGDDGLVAIANFLPRDLHELVLNVTGCGLTVNGERTISNAVEWLPELQEKDVTMHAAASPAQHPLSINKFGSNKLRPGSTSSYFPRRS